MGEDKGDATRGAAKLRRQAPRRLTLVHPIFLVALVVLALFSSWTWLNHQARTELDTLMLEQATVAADKDSLARLDKALSQALLDADQLVTTRRAEFFERFVDDRAACQAEIDALESKHGLAGSFDQLSEGLASYAKTVAGINRLQRKLGLGFGESQGDGPRLAALGRTLAEALHEAGELELELELVKLEIHQRDFAATLDMRINKALVDEADALIQSLPETIEPEIRTSLERYREGLGAISMSVVELELAVNLASLKFERLGPSLLRAREQLDVAAVDAALAVKGQREASARRSAALFGFAFALTVAFLLIQIRNALSFARRVRELAGVMEHVADGDFVNFAEVERVSSEADDEIGILSREFNRMLDVFEELGTVARAVTGGDLRVELASSGVLQDAFRTMIEHLRVTVAQTRESASTITAAAIEIADASVGQEEAANYQAECIREVSVAMQNLAAAAGDISGSASEVLQNADQTRVRADGLVENFTELEQHMARISALLQLIREISDRSDLLALNGSLEATRAGEAGRGFALVATEMRRLAERITGTTAGIREAVADIDRSTAKTAEATTDSRSLAQHTSKAAERIVELTETQSTQTEQVSEGVEDIATVLESSVAVSTETRMAASELEHQANELLRLMEGFEL